MKRLLLVVFILCMSGLFSWNTSRDSYGDDSQVLLAEYNDIKLYGINQDETSVMLLSIDGTEILIDHPFQNFYEELPKLSSADIDSDGIDEVMISVRTYTGHIKRYALFVCDYEETWQCYEYEDYVQDIQDVIDYQYDKLNNSITLYDNKRNVLIELKLPEWTEEYPYAGNINFEDDMYFDAETMQLIVTPLIECENSLPHRPVEFVFDIRFLDGEFGLGDYYIWDLVDSTRIGSFQTTENLDSWIGTYTFDEVYAEEGYAPMFMDYDVKIYKEDEQYYADVVINGHMTAIDVKAQVYGDDEWISLVLREYNSDHITGLSYMENTIMFSMRREEEQIYTYWGVLTPLLLENSESGKIYFEKIVDAPIQNEYIEVADFALCLSPENIINYEEVFEDYFDRRNRLHVRRDVSEAEELDTGVFPTEMAKVLFSLNNNSTYDDEYYQTFAPRFGASAGSEYAYYDHNTSLEDLPKEIRSYILDDSKEYLDTSIQDIQQADIDGDGDPEWVIRKNYFTRFFSDFIEIYKYIDIDIHDETVNWNAKNLCPENIGYQTFEQNGTLELLSMDGEYYILSQNIISHVSDKNTDWSEVARSTMPTETAAWDILMLDRQVSDYDAYEIYSDAGCEKTNFLDDINLLELCKKDNLKSYGVWWCEDEWYSMKSQSALTKETDSKNYYYTVFIENESFFGEKADRVLAILQQTEDGQMEIVKLYYLIAKIKLDVLPMNGEDYNEYKFEDYRLMEEDSDIDTTVYEVWCRTDVASYEPATLTISNFEAGRSFDVEIVASYSIYGGVLAGTAEFTDEDHAELKLERYDGEICTVYFQFDDDSILVEHDDRLRYEFGGGGVGTAEGRYTKQEPEYTNCTDVSEIFTEVELEEIRKMLQGSYQYLLKNVIESGEIQEFTVSDGRLLKAAWPPFGVAWCNILIYDDGRIYIQGQSYTRDAEKKYFTNCEDTKLPDEKEFQIHLFGW